MGILHQLPLILEEAEIEYRKLLEKAGNEFAKSGFFGFENPDFAHKADSDIYSGDIYICDNAEYLSQLAISKSRKIDMIYVDPPFFSRTDQGARAEIYPSKKKSPIVRTINAFGDIWGHDKSYYLKMLAVRLLLMRDVLSEDGTIFVHLDYHAVHEVKLIMDEIFGEERFINEIIWAYKSGGAAKKHFSRKHDTILFYAKSDNYKFNLLKEKSYNRKLQPYHFKDVEEFQDDIGWYTLVNMKDVWQIDMVGRSSHERLNYATQKPEQLLERIISAVTEPGDTVADFFCGSGTLAAAALKTGRHFICTDISSFAISKALKRTAGQGAAVNLYMRYPADDKNPVIETEFTIKTAVKFGHEKTARAKAAEQAETAAQTETTAQAEKTAQTEAAEQAGRFVGEALKYTQCVRLVGYKNDLQNMNFGKTHSKKKKIDKKDDEIEDLLESDSMAFIDYWGIAKAFESRLTENPAFDVDKLEVVIRPELIAKRDRAGNLQEEISLEELPVEGLTQLSPEEPAEGLPKESAEGSPEELTEESTCEKRVIFAFDVLGNIILKDISSENAR